MKDFFNKALYNLADDVSSDFQYLGIYLFICYKNHRKYNFLPNDVVSFIERAFDSNNIDFDNLLSKYKIFKEVFDLDEIGD